MLGFTPNKVKNLTTTSNCSEGWTAMLQLGYWKFVFVVRAQCGAGERSRDALWSVARYQPLTSSVTASAKTRTNCSQPTVYIHSSTSSTSLSYRHSANYFHNWKQDWPR